MRDFPEGGFGQPGYGGRGGDGGAPDLSGPDFGGDFRGVDRREADHRDLDRRDFDRRDPDRRDSDRRDPDRREGGGGPWNDAGGWGQAEPDMSGPVFTPAGPAPSPAPGAIPASAASTSTRPYGRLSIFTLLDDRVAEFDQLAEEAAEGVRVHEPDTLVYVMHVVPKAPMQRIIYEIYRDHTAFESHQRQPHILQFEEGRRSCVLVTNIIDLRLKYAKVAPLQGITPPPAGPPQLPAAQSAPAPGARHRAGPAMDSGARWLDEPSGGRPADPDGDWAADRSFSGGERRSQEWGQPQYMGQRYRDN
jgi:quinol monooxygenase YgiN